MQTVAELCAEVAFSIVMESCALNMYCTAKQLYDISSTYPRAFRARKETFQHENDCKYHHNIQGMISEPLHARSEQEQRLDWLLLYVFYLLMQLSITKYC